MATGDLVTGDWQFEFGALLVGGTTGYDVRLVDGLGGMAGIVTGDQRLLDRHGMTAGTDYLTGRQIVVELTINTTDHSARATLIDALNRAFRPGQAEQALVFQVPSIAGGGKRRVLCRVRDRSSTVDPERFNALSEVSLLLGATDPRIFDDAVSTSQTTLVSISGGRTYPLTFPRTYASVSAGGTIAADNTGTWDTPVVLRIDGPCQNPQVTNTSDGSVLGLTITVADGDFIELDSENRTVLLNGTASRYQFLTSSAWFDLAPGVTNLEFRAATATTATLTATFRSAWS